jgi:hypothetical protein
MARTIRTRFETPSPSPRLSILKILKRRKKNLRALANELGITTLASMEQWCNKFGAAPPTLEEWEEVFGSAELPPLVNDPTDGVIVITSVDLVDEKQIEEKKTVRRKQTKRRQPKRELNENTDEVKVEEPSVDLDVTEINSDLE